jgi:hypothetical protein
MLSLQITIIKYCREMYSKITIHEPFILSGE